jgi:hypothetical protein
MREPIEDLRISAENQKILALVESPVWSAFVKIIDEDLKTLDNISSLYIENQSRDDLVREIEVRYHTIIKVRSYINQMIERAEQAVRDTQIDKSDIVTFHN